MEGNVKNLANVFMVENRPITLQQMKHKLTCRKDDVIQDLLVILQYQDIISKINFLDYDFYVLKCPYYGTSKLQEHVEEWKLSLKHFHLIDKINNLQKINNELNQEIHDKALN
ncbi:hypothetical protein SS50377_23196 [Spironucleus salmonicida]|uniref:Uncharacterized protein n=1 Tax=Spironucleus salmonicida TaxID=348837 RepID=V6LNP8_9EUKA|nr:hypothetical protein SS50377_23196 [Spironucleus salmonicida]|eukprot:EST46297.1 Hypothetical protein SS50377_13683 [Spironucleus salmonicida]